MTKYNGWRNYETWNVALWIGNDEGLYNFAKDFTNYSHFADAIQEMGILQTPDNVAWNDSGLDLRALNEMMGEL